MNDEASGLGEFGFGILDGSIVVTVPGGAFAITAEQAREIASHLVRLSLELEEGGQSVGETISGWKVPDGYPS